MQNCLFCKIIKGELPSKKVYGDNDFIVFHDINPKAPVHVLIVPLKHFESLREVSDRYERLLGKMMILAKKTAQKLDISKEGYKIVINNGEASGQLVYHLHLHLLGGWDKSPGWNV